MILKKKDFAGNPEQGQPKNKKKTMASLRIQKDLVDYKSNQIQFVKLSFPNEDNLQHILVNIKPQQNSIYFGSCIDFSLIFPDDYPISPPKLLCLKKIFHPNINLKGSVCLPLLREDHSPTLNLTSILCGLIFILSYPNAEDALNPEIGDLMTKDFSMFQKIVKHTMEGRTFRNQQYDCLTKEAAKQIKNTQGKFCQVIQN